MSEEGPSDLCKFQVIGYGNTLRSDDGAGVRVAEAVAAWDLPGVASLALHQLAPELAESLASVDFAIFVDARLAHDGSEIAVSPLEPSCASRSAGHTCDPRSLLALTASLYGHQPRAWLITVPAVDLSVAEGLSTTAMRGIESACGRIRQILEGR